MSTNKVSLLFLCLFTSTCYSNSELTVMQSVAKKVSIGSFSLATITGTPGVVCKVMQLHLCSLGNFFIGQKFGTLATASFNCAKPLFGASFSCAALWAATKMVEKAQKLDNYDFKRQADGDTNYWLNKRLTTQSSLKCLAEEFL